MWLRGALAGAVVGVGIGGALPMLGRMILLAVLVTLGFVLVVYDTRRDMRAVRELRRLERLTRWTEENGRPPTLL